jgi:hypothetical protein
MKPGYVADIKTRNIIKSGVDTMEQVLINQDFRLFSKRGPRKYGCVQYDKIATTDKRVNYPLVTVQICYTDVAASETIKDFRILITNEYEGQRPEIKNEIDRIADILYRELTTLAGKENVTIYRGPMGPPF